jgi:hypothetical protein
VVHPGVSTGEVTKRFVPILHLTVSLLGDTETFAQGALPATDYERNLSRLQTMTKTIHIGTPIKPG